MILFITHVSKLMIHTGLEVRPLAEEVEPCVICDDPLTHDDVVVCSAQGTQDHLSLPTNIMWSKIAEFAK